MSIHETYFYKLPTILRAMEHCSGMTFATLVDNDDIANPMHYMASEIAKAHTADGYTFGLHADNSAVAYNDDSIVAIRLKDGNGVVVPAHDKILADYHHTIAEMTPLDFVLFATDVKTSYNGYYMLVRYDLIACYANPYLTSPDSIWEAYEGILCECRSTVIDVRDMSIVSLPYYKFRNLNETQAYDIDHVRKAIEDNHGNLVATEKLDGSMIQMRYIGDKDAFAEGLLYSTSGTLAGSSGDQDNEHLDSLVEYHLSGIELAKYLGVATAYPEMTFIYEFVHPEADRHVVVYPKDKHGLFMTGARNVITGKLATHDEIVTMADTYDIPYPTVIATDIDTALTIQKEGKGDEMEGMVVDIDGWLVKIKLDGFLELSHIFHEIEGPSGFKAIASMVLNGTMDDALPSLPDGMRDYMTAIAQRFEVFEESQRSVIDALVAEELERDGGDRKAFAMWVNDLACPSHWKSWLFQTAFSGGVTCFWADKKGENWRFISQSEFESREAALADWLGEQE